MKFLFAVPAVLCVTTLVVFDACAMPIPAVSATGSSASLTSLQDETKSNSSDAVSGTWLLTFATGNGDARHVTLQLQLDGGKLSGTARMNDGIMKGATFPITGSLEGSKVSINATVKGHSRSFTGTVEDQKMSGVTERGRAWLAVRP
jgi:hypothetical protein